MLVEFVLRMETLYLFVDVKDDEVAHFKCIQEWIHISKKECEVCLAHMYTKD